MNIKYLLDKFDLQKLARLYLIFDFHILKNMGN